MVMTAPARSTAQNLRGQPSPTTDLFQALKLYFDARNAGDRFQAESWLRQAELIEYLQRLNTDRRTILSGCERGSGRRS
jgi:hypothetical protein